MRCALAILVMLLTSSSAFAAMVTNIQGQTLINKGQGYQQVIGAAEAGPGAQVVANPGGLGQVTYPDGCAVTINPGAVYTILPASPCSTTGASTGLGINTFAIGAAVLGGAGAAIAFSQSRSASP